MIPLDYRDAAFQDLIRKELQLDDKAIFSSCEIVAGTEIAGHCIGTIFDGVTTYILLKCTFVISGDAVVLNLDLPGSPAPRAVERELDKVGLNPETTRLVGVCTNETKERREAGRMPDLQVVLIPY